MVASAALLHHELECGVEQCISRAVRFEQILKSDDNRNIYSHSGRSSFDAGSGCLTRNEQKSGSEASDSVLLISSNNDSVPELADSNDMVCIRVENFEDHVLLSL
jgi:hypothetical protein